MWASALIFTLPPKNEIVSSDNSRCQLGAALDVSKAFLRPRKPLGENGRKRAPALQSWTSHSNFAMEKQARFASSPKGESIEASKHHYSSANHHNCKRRRDSPGPCSKTVKNDNAVDMNFGASESKGELARLCRAQPKMQDLKARHRRSNLSQTAPTMPYSLNVIWAIIAPISPTAPSP